MKAEWIDIPAHRVYVVPSLEIAEEYERICVSTPPRELLRRNRDGKLFKRARRHGERISFWTTSDDGVVLEEI